VAVSLNLRQILPGHALVSTAPMAVAGASTLAGVGGDLYWALAEIVCGLVASVLYARVLLIEILR
jgi:modulator of FtsH protease